jgi:muramoyltetrapeptide carboxypeptidase
MSSPVAAACPRRYERALENARRWFDVSEGAHARARQGHLVASGAERAGDLIDAWFDDSVDAVISVIGGMTTAQMLEHLPFDDMARRPKLVIGYSDTTTLLTALACHGIPSLYGPALMPQFGESGGPHAYTLDALLGLLKPQPFGIVPEAQELIVERLQWDQEDDRPRLCEPARTRRAIRAGAADGWLFVANLGSLLSLAGTRWFPDLSGALLVLEDDDEESPDTIERMLTQLRMLGAFGRINGLVFGRLPASIGVHDDLLTDALLRATSGSSFPIAIGFEIGHVDPFHALPIGPNATLMIHEGKVSLTIHEALVASTRR